MKTILTSALIAAASLTAVPAIAQSNTAAEAVTILNQGADGNSDRVMLQDVDFADGTSVSTRSGSLDAVYDQFNESADSSSDVTGRAGATLYSGQPEFGSNIFDQLRAESAEDE